MGDEDARKVVIIGSGPAGLTAALYTARANLSPLVFEGEPDTKKMLAPGGQLTYTTEVENYPGFPNGIQGPEMMQLFREQAERFGAEMKMQNVDKVDLSSRPFKIWSYGKEYEACAVIVATGASARLLGLGAEERLMGKGVHTCATCDGAFYKGKDIALVGGGDTAMEDGNFLCRFVNKITLIHRRDTLRASKIMQDRARANQKFEWVWDTVVKDIKGEDRMESLVLGNVKTGETQERRFDALFLAIGHVPNTELYRGQVELDANGYIVLKEHSMTSVPGVFSAGDVDDHRYRQAVTAAGEGCRAAIDCERWLESEGK